MLLGIYLGTTAYVWVSTIKLFREMDQRLKEEGYTFTTKKFHGVGDIVIGTIFLITMSIPIFNLIFPIVNSNKERSYDEYKNKLLEAGSIERNDLTSENVVKLAEEVKKDSVININNSKLVSRENRDGHIYYSTLNNDEIDSQNQNGYTYRKVFFRNKN